MLRAASIRSVASLPLCAAPVRLLSSLSDDAPFEKLLVANRGEIACRVIRTARRMGVKTVAVYSDADKDAQHVLMADEAVRLGPPPASESYLLADEIVRVAKEVGAQAIHPGYGFLSENAGFASKIAAAGLTFVGPPEEAIISMGSKSASKTIMIDAGVPCIPGYHGENQDVEHLRAEAERIGYPVMLKAVLGGGGKGMRIVEKPEDFDSMLDACKRESMNSFSDDRVLIERYITRPRHVELQVFADTLGNTVHLFERDCSVQRRHQKVLEEAPAPGMSAEKRAEMGAAAVAAAQAVGYVGAGTVEFVMDEHGGFYFMEMNTRLQVEHPVTEYVTGQDLVEWQLRVAGGQRLPLLQDELPEAPVGHALEARVYAENPDNDFLPGTGKLSYLSPPEGTDRVRVDTGVVQGDEVSIYYDPMIAKLIVHGEDRPHALALMKDALRDFHVVGLPTNIEFLGRAAGHRGFVDADLDTGFIERYWDDLLPPPAATPDSALALGVVSMLLREQQLSFSGMDEHSSSPWAARSSLRLTGPARRTVELGGEEAVDVTLLSDSRFQLQLPSSDAPLQAHATLSGDGKLQATLSSDGHSTSYDATVVQDSGSLHLFVPQLDRQSFKFELPIPDWDAAAAGGRPAVKTPMPGKVVKVLVGEGESVEAGQPIMILEAMKMEHVIKAPLDSTVEALHFAAGDHVDDGRVLVEFDDGSGDAE